MLTIRLQRSGKKNQPEFRIVLAQKTAAVNKKFLEVLGNYNPRTKDFVVKNEERLKYWISQHVEISPTVHNLFVTKNILSGNKVRAFNVPKKSAEPVVSEVPVPPAEATETVVAPATAETQDSIEPAPSEAPAAPQTEVSSEPEVTADESGTEVSAK